MGPERWAQLPLGLTFRLMRMSGEAEEKAKEEMQRALLEERAEVARRRQDGWKRKAARELREGAELDESGEQEAVEIEVPVRASIQSCSVFRAHTLSLRVDWRQRHDGGGLVAKELTTRPDGDADREGKSIENFWVSIQSPTCPKPSPIIARKKDK
jgi:hypothetical protein